jgi:hypothetical protein
VRRRTVVAVVAVVVLVAALGVANVAAYAHDAQVDLSAARQFSLAPQTKGVLRQVRSPLKVIAFLNASGPAARDARFLLERYHELNHRITYSVLDPDANPGAARQYGISKYSTVVVTYRGRRVDAPSVTELEVSTAILRVVRGRTPTICALTGHGEPGLDDDSPDGLSKVGDILKHNAYDIRPLDLTVGQGGVPADCAAVLVLGPRDPIGAAEVDALTAYARNAGRLMVVSSSLTRADPNPLLDPWGIKFVGGLVLDPTRSEGADQSNVIVEDLPSASPVDDGVTRLQFPATAGLLVDRNVREGLTVEPLAVTSADSWDESNPDVEVQRDAGDLPGPLVVAAAADDSHVEATGEQRVPGGGARIVRTRVFATGSDTWLTNGYLDRLSNRRFFVNALGWLAQEEQLLARTGQVNVDRSLPLTAERQARVLIVTVGVVPGLILGAGLTANAALRRRGRRRRSR